MWWGMVVVIDEASRGICFVGLVVPGEARNDGSKEVDELGGGGAFQGKHVGAGVCTSQKELRRNTPFTLRKTTPLTSSIHRSLCHSSHVPPQAMPNPELRGLLLTRSERIIVIALSYLFCAPLIYANGRKLLSYLLSTSAEARRQVREERRQQQQEEQQGEQRQAAAG